MVKNSQKQKRQGNLTISKAEYTDRAMNVFLQMLSLAPEEHQEELMALMMDESRTTEPEIVRERFTALLANLDIESKRTEIVALLLELIPVQQLVPPVYEKYCQMVMDAAEVILKLLSGERLRIKLVEQMMLPLDASLQERLLTLITRMPTLQKIGQIIARNRNLDPEFRKRLQKLENSIKDATYEAIFECVHRELKSQISKYKIKLGNRFLAEASVCAVVPFTWRSDSGEKKRGVFKVLKPFIAKYWTEELKILDALAIHFDRNKHRYGLPTMGFRDVLREVRELFKREVKLPIEQNRLEEARNFYLSEANVRVPELLPMRTKVVTGMEFVDGMKVTSAAAKYPEQAKRIAELIIDKMIFSVIFYSGQEALFHADPHAGNVFYSEKNDELAILDWGLSCTMSREDRGEIVQLMLGFILKDKERAFRATYKLSSEKNIKGVEEVIRKRVDEVIDGLPTFPLVRLEPLTRLLDNLILDGVRFPAELLMFRKSLFTLLGVLHDVNQGFNVDWHLTRTLLGQIVSEIPTRLLRSPWSTDYPSQLSTWELRRVLTGLSAIAAKLGVKNSQLLVELGLEKAAGFVGKLSAGFKQTDTVENEA